MIRLGECDAAVSSIIGVTLLGGMTAVMASIVGVSVFASSIPDDAPHAKIVIIEAKGDIGSEDLYNNVIVLKHKGGDSLNVNNTKIIITGKGYSYASGGDPYLSLAQDIQVTYRDITGKNYPYIEEPKQIVSGTSWDAGEQIELYGRDGINIGHANQGNTVDGKWKIDNGTTVSVTIIDTATNEVIAVSRATVKDA